MGRSLVACSDWPAQLRLAAVLTLNLMVIPASFALEDRLQPWQARMDATTAGWCLVLAQAVALGSIAALAVREGSLAVVQGLLIATLVGYAYVLAGQAMIDPRRSVQLAHLIFRAVELGMLAIGAFTTAFSARVLLHERLRLCTATPTGARRQYGLAELMFLMIVFSLGAWMLSLFFDHFDREAQLQEIVSTTLRALPATLPVIWLATQSTLKPPSIAGVLSILVVTLWIKAAIDYALTGDDFLAILFEAGQRAVVYASGAAVNGLLLRLLGFRWCSVE
jgi:hypothetical protein